MKKTVIKVEGKRATFRVVHDDSKEINPYSIYQVWYRDGGWHRKKIAEYASMTCCLYHIAQQFSLYLCW